MHSNAHFNKRVGWVETVNYLKLTPLESRNKIAEWLGSKAAALSPVRSAPGIPAPSEARRRSSLRRIKAPIWRQKERSMYKIKEIAFIRSKRQNFAIPPGTGSFTQTRNANEIMGRADGKGRKRRVRRLERRGGRSGRSRKLCRGVRGRNEETGGRYAVGCVADFAHDRRPEAQKMQRMPQLVPKIWQSRMRLHQRIGPNSLHFRLRSHNGIRWSLPLLFLCSIANVPLVKIFGRAFCWRTDSFNRV